MTLDTVDLTFLAHFPDNQCSGLHSHNPNRPNTKSAHVHVLFHLFSCWLCVTRFIGDSTPSGFAWSLPLSYLSTASGSQTGARELRLSGAPDREPLRLF